MWYVHCPTAYRPPATFLGLKISNIIISCSLLIIMYTIYLIRRLIALQFVIDNDRHIDWLFFHNSKHEAYQRIWGSVQKQEEEEQRRVYDVLSQDNKLHRSCRTSVSYCLRSPSSSTRREESRPDPVEESEEKLEFLLFESDDETGKKITRGTPN